MKSEDRAALVARIQHKLAEYAASPFGRDVVWSIDGMAPLLRDLLADHARLEQANNRLLGGGHDEGPVSPANKTANRSAHGGDTGVDITHLDAGPRTDRAGDRRGLDPPRAADQTTLLARLAACERDNERWRESYILDVAANQVAKNAAESRLSALLAGGWLKHKLGCKIGKPVGSCPACGNALRLVKQSENSPLNEYQFDSVKAGDYYCEKCTGDQAQGSTFRYWWTRELSTHDCSCGLDAVQKGEGK